MAIVEILGLQTEKVLVPRVLFIWLQEVIWLVTVWHQQSSTVL